MAARPVQISVEVGLLERIDSDPETREKGRFAFIGSAVRHYLREKERAATDRQIREAFHGKADRMLAEIADMVDGQASPRD